MGYTFAEQIGQNLACETTISLTFFGPILRKSFESLSANHFITNSASVLGISIDFLDYSAPI